MPARRLVLVFLSLVLLFTGTAQASNSSDEQLAGQLQKYLESKNSPLAPYGRNFVIWGRRYGVDPRFMVAISGAETSFGTYGPSQAIHNAWGIGPGIDMGSWQHGIKFEAELLGTYYRHKRTIKGVREKWAPGGVANDPTNLNAHWVKNVAHYYSELGGDPNGNVFVVPEGVKPVPDKEVQKYAETFLLGQSTEAQSKKTVDSSAGGKWFLGGSVALLLFAIGFKRRQLAPRAKRRRSSYSRRRF